jgi:predicted nucleotidyltransferase
MNIPSKIARSNYLQPDKVQEHQAAASKYYKQYTKLRKRSGEGDSLIQGSILSLKTSTRKSSINNNTINNTHNPSSLKDEIISWFFSLDLITKLIISSIENKWVTNLLHQLYIHQKYQPNLRFQIKEGDLINVAMPSKETEYAAQVLRVGLVDNRESVYNPNPNHNYSCNTDYFNYSQYFINKEEHSCNNSLNNFCGISPQKIQEDFLNELKFYKSEDLILNDLTYDKVNKYCNYFTLSEKILQDEKLFRFYFDKLSSDQAFLNLIPSSYDNNSKHHSIYLPEWIKNKEYYSASEIFLAFFEQVITVKYIIHKQYPNQFKLSSHLEQLMKEREESILYLKKSKKNAKEILEHIRDKKIIENIFADTNINSCVMSKLYQGNPHIYYTFTNFNFEDVVFDKENLKSWEIERKLEKFLFNVGYDKDVEKFIDKLMYFNIDKIFSFDDFLFRKIFEFVTELRQKESFDDLMNDDLLEELINGNGGNSTGTSNAGVGSTAKSNNKKKKKKKAGNTIKDKDTVITITSISTGSDKSNTNCNTTPTEIVPNSVSACSDCIIAEATAKEEKKYAFSFIKRKPEKDYVILDVIKETKNEDTKPAESKECDDYENKEFLGNVMLIKKQVSGIGKLNSEKNCTKNKEQINKNNFITTEITKEVKDLVEEIVSKVCFKFTFEMNDYEKDININRAKEDNLKDNQTTCKLNEIRTDSMNSNPNNKNTINNSSSSLAINTNINLPNNLTEKLSSPTFSAREDQNDTDTAYSSEGNISTSKGGEKFKKNKKEKNKFFLYNVNKAPKKSTPNSVSNNIPSSTNASNTNNVNEAYNYNSLNSPKSNTGIIISNNTNVNEGTLNVKPKSKNVTNINNPSSSLTLTNQNIKNMNKPSSPSNTYSLNPLSKSANNTLEKINTNVFITNTNKIFKNEKNEKNEENLKMGKNTSLGGDNQPKEVKEGKDCKDGNLNNLKNINNFHNFNNFNNPNFTNIPSPTNSFYSKRHNSANDQHLKENLNSDFPNPSNNLYSNINNNMNNMSTNNSSNSNSNIIYNFTQNDFKDLKFNSKRKYSTGTNNTGNNNNNNYFPHPNRYSKGGVNVNVNVYNVNNIQNFNNYNYTYNPTFNNNFYPKPNMFNYMQGGLSHSVTNINNININQSLNNPIENLIPFQHPFTHYFPNPIPLPLNPSPNDFFLTHNPMAFEFFQFKLHKDILDFCEATEKLLLILKPFKASIIIYLENQIKEFLLKEYKIKSNLEVYGSFASEMDIETSDMDVTIKIEDECEDLDYSFIMKKLVDYLNRLKIFDCVNPIYTASVPVIKLQVDPLNILEDSLREKYLLFKTSENYKNYKFEINEINLVKIDLTFCDDIRKKNRNVNVSLKHVEMIKNSCLVFPELKPLIKVLKRFLSSNKLNCTFNGKINSGGLFCENLKIYFLKNF